MGFLCCSFRGRDGAWSRAFSRNELPDPHTARFYECLANLKADMTASDFLNQHFAGPEYSRLRHFVLRKVEGYDAADPARASMLELRDEWTNSSRSVVARIVGGYGALIDFLAADCGKQGATIHLNATVSAIETIGERAVVHCANGDIQVGDAAILTVPLPVLNEIMLPPALCERTAAAADSTKKRTMDIEAEGLNAVRKEKPQRHHDGHFATGGSGGHLGRRRP